MRDLKDLKEEEEPALKKKIPPLAIVGLLGLLVFFTLMLFFRGKEETPPPPPPAAGALPTTPAGTSSAPPSAVDETPAPDPALRPGEIHFSEKKEEFSPPPGASQEAKSSPSAGKEKPAPKDDLTFFKTLKDKNQETALQPEKKMTAKAKPKESTKGVAKPASFSPSTASKRFSIQVASFSEKKGADQLAEKLKKKGLDAYVVSGEVPQKGKWYRVRVGRYPSRVEAQRAGDRLHSSERLNFFITSE